MLLPRPIRNSHGSSGEYWHPAHLLVFEAMESALGASSSGKPAWLTVMARDRSHALPGLINCDDEAHLQIDVSLHNEKQAAALNCHETQLELFRRWIEGTPDEFIERFPQESYCLRRPGELEIAEATDIGKGEGNH